MKKFNESKFMKMFKFKESRLDEIIERGTKALDEFYDRHGEWDGELDEKKKRKIKRDHN